MIGAATRRVEDRRLITGHGRYVDDLAPDGVLHAVFVRSVEAHATVGAIRFQPPAGDNASVLLTATDLELLTPMTVQNPSPLILQGRTPPPLAGDEVCYVGQPIAVVLADSANAAADAAEAVLVDYEPLPVSVDHRHTLDPDAPPVHRDGTSNLVAQLHAAYGDATSVIEASDQVVRLEVDQHRGAVASLEGRAVMASWEKSEERLTIWTSSQAPHAVRAAVAAYLGLSPDMVRVVAPDVGGGFGPKAVVYPEEIVIAAVARRLGMPVKWTEQRREHFVATIQQRGQTGRVEAAYDEDGRVLALRARLLHDLGAFVPYGVVVPSTTLRLMSGPYVIPALDVELDCVFTNTTPTGAIRGAGRPNATFIVERVMDAVAAELSLDRAEVRQRNFISSDDFPYQVDIPGSDGSPVTYDGGDYQAAMVAAMGAADLEGFEGRRAISATSGRLRGYGIACYVEDTGLGPFDGARIDILPNGEVSVAIGASSQGQGHATVFAQICAQHLGVDVDQVRVHGGDTDSYPDGVATVASRTAQSGAAVVHVTAAELAEKIKAMAAQRLEAAVADIVLTDGVAMVVGQPGCEIPLGDLARSSGSTDELDPSQESGLSTERILTYGGSAFTYGTHVAEVEIDTETGHTAVTSYVVVHDCGVVLNPMIVDGQIDGGVAHGLGNALSERMVHDETGQPLTTSFMDYRLMTADDMPRLTKIHFETPAASNPLGAKGAGEGGTIPAAAAVVSAVEHALGGTVRITHYPLSPEWILGAIRG